jgi:formate dehydrogenase maturation protein FdhE
MEIQKTKHHLVKRLNALANKVRGLKADIAETEKIIDSLGDAVVSESEEENETINEAATEILDESAIPDLEDVKTMIKEMLDEIKAQEKKLRHETWDGLLQALAEEK